MNEPAFLELFIRLREAGFPLGLEEYHLLLQALHAGFGTSDRQTLAELCCTLWIKSEDEKRIFQEYFDQLIPEQNSIRENISANPRHNGITITPSGSFQINRFLVLGVLSSFIVVVGAILILLGKLPKSHGILSFSGTTTYIFNKNDRFASIEIVRTDGNSGKVSATLNIRKTHINSTKKNLKNLKLTPIKNVTFPDSTDGVQEVRIPIINMDGDEQARLYLTNPQGGVKIGNSATLIIVDNELSYWLSIVGREWFTITIVFFLIVLIALGVQSVRRRTRDSDDGTTSSEDQTNLPQVLLSPEVIQYVTDEIQVAKAISQSDNQFGESFPLIAKDLPVTYRQMKQGWRYLRNFAREGVPTELDIEATVHQIGQQGFLLNPVLTPRRINKIELLLLIDQDGSMVPFEHIAQAIAQTASQGGRFNQVRVHYFHNCPGDYLYRDPYHLEAELIEDCLSQLPKTKVVCLIFSDAGAARGGFNSKRRRLTKSFLKQLKQHVRHVAWLNPVPRTRWEDTTAGAIARFVPMFEVNRQELYKAIDTMRGRHQPLGNSLH